jgi:hypothetical protein
MPAKLFLLSPATLSGLRAKQLMSIRAKFALATRYRSAEGVEIGDALNDDDQVVLLGSVATGKYVDVLWPILGSRLRFPVAFAGLGDMARGGLMLRAAREGKELEYRTLDGDRKRPPGATGKMPKL